MSLLMEALRKAEEAKRRIQTQNPHLPSAFGRIRTTQPDISPMPVLSAALEPDFETADAKVDSAYIADNLLRAANNESAAGQRPSAFFTSRNKSGRASVEELQSYLETTPEPEETLHAARTGRFTKHRPDLQQRAAGAVFAAKQKPVKPGTTRNVLLTALLLTISIGAAGLWYLAGLGDSSILVDPALLTGNGPPRSLSDELYAQQENVARNTASFSSAVPAPTAVQEQNPAPSPQNEIAVPELPATPQQVDVAAVVSAQAANSPAMTSSTQVPAEIAEQDTPAAVSEPAPPAAASNESLQAPGGQVLEVSHSVGGVRKNQQLHDAYASLQAGDVDAAAALYQQVLEQFPNNRDALLGNAALAMRQGDLVRAREFYSRLMQLNPKDPLARTGLLQTVQEIDPAQHEQELQRLIQQHPDVAPLSFAIGNLYAAQRRWNEAQSAYFDAFLFAKQNEGAVSPDYAYNLAVSLEQLRQPQAALDYYRQAQTLATEVSPGFDPQELSRRISFLERGSR